MKYEEALDRLRGISNLVNSNAKERATGAEYVVSDIVIIPFSAGFSLNLTNDYIRGIKAMKFVASDDVELVVILKFSVYSSFVKYREFQELYDVHFK